jgi:hypothetical protein
MSWWVIGMGWNCMSWWVIGMGWETACMQGTWLSYRCPVATWLMAMGMGMGPAVRWGLFMPISFCLLPMNSPKELASEHEQSEQSTVQSSRNSSSHRNHNKTCEINRTKVKNACWSWLETSFNWLVKFSMRPHPHSLVRCVTSQVSQLTKSKFRFQTKIYR